MFFQGEKITKYFPVESVSNESSGRISPNRHDPIWTVGLTAREKNKFSTFQSEVIYAFYAS